MTDEKTDLEVSLDGFIKSLAGWAEAQEELGNSQVECMRVLADVQLTQAQLFTDTSSK